MDDRAEDAIAALQRGECVVLPTDTVYGLAALPSVPGATDALFALKGRAADHALAVLVADRAQAEGLCAEPGPGTRRLIERFWPGPLTLVLPRAAAARHLDLGGDPATIGLRWPRHDFVQRVAAAVGPIATTSANRHGEPTPPTAPEAAASLLGPVAVVVDAGPLPGLASTVVDLCGPVPVILREGAIAAADVLAAWEA